MHNIEPSLDRAAAFWQRWPSGSAKDSAVCVVGSALRHAHPRDIDIFVFSDDVASRSANDLWRGITDTGVVCSDVSSIVPLGVTRFKVKADGREFSVHFVETSTVLRMANRVGECSHYLNTSFFGFDLFPQVAYRFWIVETHILSDPSGAIQRLQQQVHPSKAPWAALRERLRCRVEMSLDYLSRHHWQEGLGVASKIVETINYLLLTVYARLEMYAGTARTVDDDLRHTDEGSAIVSMCYQLLRTGGITSPACVAELSESVRRLATW